MVPRGFFFSPRAFFAAKISRRAKNFVLVSRSVTSSFESANLAGSRSRFPLQIFRTQVVLNFGPLKKGRLEQVEIKQVF
jgi:hypothetical protein